MMDDDETTAKSWRKSYQSMAIVYVKKLHWHVGHSLDGHTVDCQMIRDANKEKQLALARRNIGDGVSDCMDTGLSKTTTLNKHQDLHSSSFMKRESIGIWGPYKVGFRLDRA